MLAAPGKEAQSTIKLGKENVAEVPYPEIEPPTTSSGVPPRKFRAPITSSLTMPEQPRGHHKAITEYFSALYSKHAPNKKRKNKSFADGVLEVKDGWVMLWSQEGKVVSRSKLTFKGALENGVCLVVGGNEVEVDEPLSSDAFSSGSCFMKATTALGPTHTAKPHMPTGFKRVKPQSDAAVQAPPPHPMHDPTAPDALICNQLQLVCVPLD